MLTRLRLAIRGRVSARRIYRGHEYYPTAITTTTRKRVFGRLYETTVPIWTIRGPVVDLGRGGNDGRGQRWLTSGKACRDYIAQALEVLP